MDPPWKHRGCANVVANNRLASKLILDSSLITGTWFGVQSKNIQLTAIMFRLTADAFFPKAVISELLMFDCSHLAGASLQYLKWAVLDQKQQPVDVQSSDMSSNLYNKKWGWNARNNVWKVFYKDLVFFNPSEQCHCFVLQPPSRQDFCSDVILLPGQISWSDYFHSQGQGRVKWCCMMGNVVVKRTGVCPGF